MTYKTGEWGQDAQLRSKRRLEYFRNYREKFPSKRNPKKNKYVGTSLGYKGEVLGRNILEGAEKINRPCDLKWKGKLVDVKTAIKHKYVNKHTNGERVAGHTYRWKFLLEKQRGKVDLFLIICKDLDEKVKYILLIPDKELTVKNLSIPENNIGKYSKYLLSLL